MIAGSGVDRRPAPETKETNYIEPEPARDMDPRPRAQTPNTTPRDNPERLEFVSTEQMSMSTGPQVLRSTGPGDMFTDVTGLCGFRPAGGL